MRQCSDLAENWVVSVDSFALMNGIAFRKHHAHEMIGERRLAHTLRTDDQPSVMHPATREGIGELAQRGIMAEQRIDLARCGEAFEAIRLRDHGARTLDNHAHGLRRCSTTSQTSSATMASGWLASITTQRSASSSEMSRKARRTRSCSISSWLSK